jgi:hypothetical protein
MKVTLTSQRVAVQKEIRIQNVVITPLVRGRRGKGADISLRSFGSCHHPAVTSGNSIRKRGMDNTDYEREVIKLPDYCSLCTEMGLTVNENKIKFMALNDPAYSNLIRNRSFVIELYDIEVVTECIYLGALINFKIVLEKKLNAEL